MTSVFAVVCVLGPHRLAVEKGSNQLFLVGLPKLKIHILANVGGKGYMLSHLTELFTNDILGHVVMCIRAHIKSNALEWGEDSGWSLWTKTKLVMWWEKDTMYSPLCGNYKNILYMLLVSLCFSFFVDTTQVLKQGEAIYCMIWYTYWRMALCPYSAVHIYLSISTVVKEPPSQLALIHFGLYLLQLTGISVGGTWTFIYPLIYNPSFCIQVLSKSLISANDLFLTIEPIWQPATCPCNAVQVCPITRGGGRNLCSSNPGCVFWRTKGSCLCTKGRI